MNELFVQQALVDFLKLDVFSQSMPMWAFLQNLGAQIQPLKDCYAGGKWQAKNEIAMPK